VEGFERTRLHSQLYDAWIDEETRTRPSPAALLEWEVLLAHAGYLFQIRDMIFTLVDRRDLLDESGYDLGDLSLVADKLRAALHQLARRFVAFLDREKRALGVVDFDDLLIRTLALLDDQKMLDRARRQYDFIFVDEFQDTDRTQAKIIDRLARDSSGRYVDG